MKKIAIFASGTGSNFLAIHEKIKEKYLQCELAILVSDRPKSKAVKNANLRNIDTFSFTPKAYPNKDAFEKEIVHILKTHEVDLIVLAGYMRLIGPTLLKHYEGRIINIHPSLLPLYKGKDAVGQALSASAVQTGVTVHYVDSGMDTGTVIAQESCPIYDQDTRETLETRIHKIEHQLYPKVIKQLLEEK